MLFILFEYQSNIMYGMDMLPILTIKGIVVPGVVPARLELKWCNVSSTPANSEYTNT